MGNEASKPYVCGSCRKGDCKNCESSITCDCECNVNGAADIIQKSVTTAAGIGTAVGGLALTILSGGLAIPIGGVMMGAGISAAYQGIEKSIKNERISGAGLAADVAFGATTGVVTGGIGAAGGAVAANVGKQVVKTLVVRAGTGVVAGVAGKAIDEVKTCVTTGKEWRNYGQALDKNGNVSVGATIASWTSGAVVGAIGGSATQLSSAASGSVSNGLAKAVTHVGVSAGSAALVDATSQGLSIAAGTQEEFEIKRTVLASTVGGITTAAMEGAKNGIHVKRQTIDNNLKHDAPGHRPKTVESVNQHHAPAEQLKADKVNSAFEKTEQKLSANISRRVVSFKKKNMASVRNNSEEE